jgi:phage repressor protein C with HTH and peptisase S24 domain
MLSHAQIWSAIDGLAKRNGLSASALARKAGLDPTTFNRSKRFATDGRPRWPSTESLAKIMQATGTSLDGFYGDLAGAPRGGRAVPLLGFAQAGQGGFFDVEGFPAGVGWDEVTFPEADGGLYALTVSGDSMLPLYRDGDRLIVSRTAEIRRDDKVVARTRDGEVMAKILLRKTSKGVELGSLNPNHPARSFAPEELDWLARILWASQ